MDGKDLHLGMHLTGLRQETAVDKDSSALVNKDDFTNCNTGAPWKNIVMGTPCSTNLYQSGPFYFIRESRKLQDRMRKDEFAIPAPAGREDAFTLTVPARSVEIGTRNLPECHSSQASHPKSGRTTVNVTWWPPLPGSIELCCWLFSSA
nr:early nodulin-like protein 1 [Ipomoea batatas]